MKRTATVAGQFYPQEPQILRDTIANLSPAKADPKKAIAVIAPHAGYVYSGAVAAETFSQINIPESIVILGPNHHGAGEKLAVMQSGTWQMPFGDVTINSALASDLLTPDAIFKADHRAHTNEHSLEVQIPFLQYFADNFSILPICLSFIPFADCQKAGEQLAAAIKKSTQETLIIASTDMSHYESRQEATRKDNMAMECINNLEAEALYNTVVNKRISMCGFIPTTIAIIAAKILGAKKASLVRYTDSGETSGDTSQVVGYAGYVID